MTQPSTQPPRNLGMPLHCPRCQRLMVFIGTTGTEPKIKRVYRCSEHGDWVLQPDIYFKWVPLDLHDL